MVRPKLATKRQKDFHVMLNESEIQDIKIFSERLGLTASAFARMILLNACIQEKSKEVKK